MYMYTSGSPDSQVEIIFCCVIWPCYCVQGTVARNPLRVGLICTPLIHGHLPGTATHIKVLHTPLLRTFISSYLIHSLSFPPLLPSLLPYLHPPLPHSPLQRWSLGSLVNGPLINEVIPWALPLQPLVFAVHGASSLRPIITVHRVQEVQTATARLVKHTANGSMWPYPTQIHTHIRPIAYIDLCTRSLPPSILRSH